jgi:hypothetical protein
MSIARRTAELCQANANALDRAEDAREMPDYSYGQQTPGRAWR